MKYNLYKELGLTIEATQQDVKNAYRNLAKTAHPDVGGSQEDFARIAEAYEVLSDPIKRAFYDQHGYYISDSYEKAMSLFSDVLAAVLTSGGVNIESDDCIAHVIRIISAKIEESSTKMAKLQTLVRKVQSGLSRLSSDNEKKSSDLNLVMSQKIRLTQQDLDKTATERIILESALDIAKSFSYATDKKDDSDQERPIRYLMGMWHTETREDQ